MCILKLVTVISVTISVVSAFGQDKITVRPQEIDDVLTNPGMGWTTFHSFNGDEKNKNYPRCSIAYFRYYWDELEPEQGNYKWYIIDQEMATAKERGQDFALRVMPANGTPKTPDWVRKLGCKGVTYYDGKSWMPDYSDPIYLEYMGRLVAELGKRYDGHPNLDHVDIGSLGHWGEWHVSSVKMNMPSFEVKKKIIDMYLQAFKHTPLVMLIGDAEGLRYAVSNGAGFRADCLGDMGGFSANWCHMNDFYPQAIAKGDVEDAWKKAPVVFEVCWVMQHWKDKEWDLDYIIEQSLKWHISVLNAKSSPVPEQWWPQVNLWLKKMGYRFVLRKFTYPEFVKPGDKLSFTSWWENKGVAPCYRKMPLAFRLKSEKRTEILFTDADIRGWLPGDILYDNAVTIPSDMPKGEYDLQIAILDMFSDKPMVQLAIAAKQPDGWYNLGKIKIQD